MRGHTTPTSHPLHHASRPLYSKWGVIADYRGYTGTQINLFIRLYRHPLFGMGRWRQGHGRGDEAAFRSPTRSSPDAQELPLSAIPSAERVGTWYLPVLTPGDEKS